MRYRKLAAVLAVLVSSAFVAEEAVARDRNPAFYGTPRKQSARSFSSFGYEGRPNVRTFSTPFYGGGGGFIVPRNRRFVPFYRQPVVLYPPVIVNRW